MVSKYNLNTRHTTQTSTQNCKWRRNEECRKVREWGRRGWRRWGFGWGGGVPTLPCWNLASSFWTGLVWVGFCVLTGAGRPRTAGLKSRRWERRRKCRRKEWWGEREGNKKRKLNFNSKSLETYSFRSEQEQRKSVNSWRRNEDSHSPQSASLPRNALANTNMQLICSFLLWKPLQNEAHWSTVLYFSHFCPVRRSLFSATAPSSLDLSAL